jgi:hypothetical protein
MMKKFFEEAGYLIGGSIFVLTIAIAARIDNSSKRCADTCGARGVAGFHEVHQPGCQANTPVCECRP